MTNDVYAQPPDGLVSVGSIVVDLFRNPTDPENFIVNVKTFGGIGDKDFISAVLRVTAQQVESDDGR